MDDYLREDYRGDEDISDEDEGCGYSSSDDEEAQACDSHGKINIQKLMERMEDKKNLSTSGTREDDPEEEELDDFEKEMRIEFESRAQDAKSTFLSSTSNNKFVESNSASTTSTSGKKTYDDIYFDSDEEEESGSRVKDKKTNDELLYDPGEDDRDQAWVDSIRRSYQNETSKKKTTAQSTVKPLPNSDAVLNCPACFAVVCLDCQRHDIYKNQYRAMFVMNCTVDTSKGLAYTDSKKSIKKKKKMGIGTEEELYNPVKCDACQTQLAVYDKDEIYHFFNIVSSHS